MSSTTEANYSLIDIFEDDDHAESEIFHEYTKLNRRNVQAIGRRNELIKKDPRILGMMARSWKTYPGAAVIKCPDTEAPKVDFADVMARRRSTSSLGLNFTGESISFEQLAGMLRMAYGPTRSYKSPKSNTTQHFRATTSAGALYPTEIYVLVSNVDDLAPGLYHYRPIEHELEAIRTDDLRQQFIDGTAYPDLAGTCSAAVLMTSMLRRTMSKYQNRGYRFALYDCGALLQSLYLCATAMNMDTCALGGVFDDEIATLLGVNPTDEPVQLGFLIGPRTAELPTTT